MAYFVAYSDLNTAPAFRMFEGATADEAFLALADHLGGHGAIALGYALNRGNGYSGQWDRKSENRQFWGQVMHDLFEPRDMGDKAWFAGDDRAKVEAEATAYYNGEETE